MRIILLIMILTGTAQATEYKARISPEETEAIWIKSCRLSLWIAQTTYGSKVTFPSKRDRMAFVKETCEKAKSAELIDFAKMKKLSPEEHACLFITDRGDLIHGFEKYGTDGMDFAVQYCEKL